MTVSLCTKPQPWKKWRFPVWCEWSRPASAELQPRPTLTLWLGARPYHPPSVLDPTDAPLAEWEQIPAVWFQIWWKPKEHRLQIDASSFGMICSVGTHGCTVISIDTEEVLFSALFFVGWFVCLFVGRIPEKVQNRFYKPRGKDGTRAEREPFTFLCGSRNHASFFPFIFTIVPGNIVWILIHTIFTKI